MAPFGGAPTRGFDVSSERLAELARFFNAGKSALELVQTYASGDLVVLVMIERQRGEVGGLPDQDWSLRVTQVYRREGSAPLGRASPGPGVGGATGKGLIRPSQQRA